MKSQLKSQVSDREVNYNMKFLFIKLSTYAVIVKVADIMPAVVNLKRKVLE